MEEIRKFNSLTGIDLDKETQNSLKNPIPKKFNRQGPKDRNFWLR